MDYAASDVKALRSQLRALGGSDVLAVGQLPADVVLCWTKQIEGNLDAVLTGKRRIHYLKRHPEVGPIEEWVLYTLLDPDEVHRNRADGTMAIFYRQLDDTHYVRVAAVMQESPNKLKHSVLSARIAGEEEVEKEQPRRVWWRTKR